MVVLFATGTLHHDDWRESPLPRWSAPCCALRLHDLAARAAPIFIDETSEDDHTYQGRLFWSSDFRVEVLAHSQPTSADRPFACCATACRSALGWLYRADFVLGLIA